MDLPWCPDSYDPDGCQCLNDLGRYIYQKHIQTMVFIHPYYTYGTLFLFYGTRASYKPFLQSRGAVKLKKKIPKFGFYSLSWAFTMI